MALSPSEAKEIYTWLSVGWPNTIRPGASDDFVRTKMWELSKDFQRYSKDEVLAAIDRWRVNNEKCPTSKNLINEIEWLRAERKARRKAETGDTDEWPMEIVFNDGYEACVGIFGREEFINHPRNTEHLQPEEWCRRFKARRDKILENLRRARS